MTLQHALASGSQEEELSKLIEEIVDYLEKEEKEAESLVAAVGKGEGKEEISNLSIMSTVEEQREKQHEDQIEPLKEELIDTV